MGDDATSVSLQLPEGIGSLWLDCILTPTPHLQNVDDETIAAYVKVCAYLAYVAHQLWAWAQLHGLCLG